MQNEIDIPLYHCSSISFCAELKNCASFKKGDLASWLEHLCRVCAICSKLIIKTFYFKTLCFY